MELEQEGRTRRKHGAYIYFQYPVPALPVLAATGRFPLAVKNRIYGIIIEVYNTPLRCVVGSTVPV
jgi:hypothetical protein